MLFSRRIPLSLKERLRSWIWPRRSFRRSIKYMGKRILRIAATPHAIAAGLAIGVFSACTPLIGFHIILAVAVAWALRVNVAAAALGTAFANPLTIPILLTCDYKVGHAILLWFDASEKIPLHNPMSMLREKSLAETWDPIVKPILLGSIVNGVVLAILIYAIAFWATSRFQRLKHEKLKVSLAKRNGNSNQ